MRSITPLTIEDFNKGAITVISKVEIDTDGAGNFQELPDIKTYSISTNEENRVAKFCSYSFNITCLNIDDRYGPLNSSSPYYNYLKQGRRIKLWAGIRKDEEDHPYQLILGRVDDFKLSKKAGEDICTITGRCLMRMVLDFKLYSPNTHWGTSATYNTVANKIRYDMEADCKGVYQVFLDSTSPYDGSHLEEIYENSDWSYDWHNNQLIFTPKRIPDFVGTNNLKVYYFQIQNVEDVVADILLAAGIFANDAERNAWLVSEYCTATEKTIERVWFNTGTSALKAITLLSEVIQYRFYFDYAGNPIFKQKPSTDSPVNTISDYETKVENVGESVDETYTHIIVIGEERDRVEGDDEVAPDVPTGLALTTGFGESTQAGLAYIKATWDANTESDFGHYELRIKKNADSDYTEVSTIATSFMFLGLEPGVTYNVQIRACDIYENRSDWSTVQNIVSATDEGTPAKTTGQTATAIVAGIKIEWTKNSENNIMYYLIERQQSPDNVDWSANWIEIARIDGDMWLDLLLTYSYYYRYRITAYTVAGVVGVTSDFTAARQPSQVGENDIAANAVTAVKIDVINLSAIIADMGHITAGDITLDSDGFICSSGKTYGAALAGFWMGYNIDKYKLHIGTNTQYLKWDGANLAIAGSIVIKGGSGIANLTDAGALATLDSIAYAAITGAKPPVNADYFGGVAGTLAYYNLVSAALLDNTIIIGGYIRTSLLTATNIRVGYLRAVQFRCGGGTDEDIYFEDSGIRMYDALSGVYKRIYWQYGAVNFARLSYKSDTGHSWFYLVSGAYDVHLTQQGDLAAIRTTGRKIQLGAGTAELQVYTTGQVSIPNKADAPTSNNYYGQLIFDSYLEGAGGKLHVHTTAWRWIASNLGW